MLLVSSFCIQSLRICCWHDWYLWRCLSCHCTFQVCYYTSLHDLKINLTSPTNAWHDSEDLQFKWLKNQNESWVWTILLVDSFFTDFLCRMYILWWQCLLRLYIQYQFFSSCMFDLMNVILDFWYNSHMEQKIFKDSCESTLSAIIWVSCQYALYDLKINLT